VNLRIPQRQYVAHDRTMSPRNSFYFLLSLSLAASAQASSSLTVNFDPAGRYLSPLEFVDANGNAQGYAGVIQVTLNGNELLDVFCVDIYHDVSPGVTYTYNTYSVTDPVAASFSPNILQAAWLYVNELPVVDAAPTAQQGIYGAALQLAIWDVIHDGGDGLSAGTVQAQTSPTPDPNSAAASALANTWIADSVGQTSTSATLLMNVAGPTASQTFITASSLPLTQSVSPVPEPATMGLAGAVLLLIGVAGRRKRTVQ
jgi:PEP-CTERM motif